MSFCVPLKVTGAAPATLWEAVALGYGPSILFYAQDFLRPSDPLAFSFLSSAIPLSKE